MTLQSYLHEVFYLFNWNFFSTMFKILHCLPLFSHLRLRSCNLENYRVEIFFSKDRLINLNGETNFTSGRRVKGVASPLLLLGHYLWFSVLVFYFLQKNFSPLGSLFLYKGSSTLVVTVHIIIVPPAPALFLLPLI